MEKMSELDSEVNYFTSLYCLGIHCLLLTSLTVSDPWVYKWIHPEEMSL